MGGGKEGSCLDCVGCLAEANAVSSPFLILMKSAAKRGHAAAQHCSDANALEKLLRGRGTEEEAAARGVSLLAGTAMTAYVACRALPRAT